MGASLAAGCTGEIGGGGHGEDSADAAGNPALTIVAPAEGSVFARQSLSALGALVAEVPVSIATVGPIERIDVFIDDTHAGEGEQVVAALAQDGPVAIRVVGYDADGAEIAEASVGVIVEAPQVQDCYGWLDLYQLDYQRGPNNAGVDLPVTVTTPINGMVYRYFYNEDPRATFFMHCELALALAKAAPIMRERDVVEILDIGVYNYRCIGGEGEPPDCPQGISQHAYARAIDMAGFTTSDDEFFSVNDDWVIDGAGESTCGAATEGPRDEFLHEIICAMKAEGVWNIVLTPNYNAGHRNHFHVDLKTGSDFIRREAGGVLTIPTTPASACGTH